MPAVFIVGTDTGVGKTIVTGLLARYLSESGLSVITQKWVETGCSKKISEDIKTHLALMKKNISYIKGQTSNVSPYVFRAACSPHLASSMEQRKISPGKIRNSFKILSKRFNFVLVETAGGALVPYRSSSLLIDLAKGLHIPVLIVAGNKLGAINHTLLTVEALKKRKMKIIGIIFNNLKKEESAILRDNPRVVQSISSQKVFGILPRCNDYHGLYHKFLPMAKKIAKELLSHP
jgi:dethiobiotin synthetase